MSRAGPPRIVVVGGPNGVGKSTCAAALLRDTLRLYRPLARTWRIYDNSTKAGPRLVASGGLGRRAMVEDRTLWTSLERQYGRR